MENKKSIIAIGDIHGLTYWKEVVKDNPNCKYVFLGDYLDPNEDIAPDLLLDNLKEIIRLKQTQPDDVVLLLGNHDLHYISAEAVFCTRYNVGLAPEISELLFENYRLFQFAFQDENTVFTHAGIAHQWFINDFKGDRHKNIADQLNHPTPEQEPTLYQCGECRGGDKDTIGGIFWADRSELDEPLQGYTQIVGHNRVDDITVHSKNGGEIIFCDCLFNKRYLNLG
jgi:hypothetical protein